MPDTIGQINEYLDLLFTYGTFWVYTILFIACLIENLFPPFPGDTFILAAGGLIAVNRLDPAISLIVIISGGMTSVLLLYRFGQRHGRNFFVKKNYRYLPATDIYKMEDKFNRFGPLILLFSRFVVGARSVLALVAGISRYSFAHMIIYSVISYLLFAGLLLYLSATLVDNYDLIGSFLRTYSMLVWPILIILAIAWIVLKRRSFNGETEA